MNLVVLSLAAMPDALDIAAVHSTTEAGRPVGVERVEMRLIRLPLKEAFETSFGSIQSRLIFLVSVEANGETGWGEVVAAEERQFVVPPSGGKQGGEF